LTSAINDGEDRKNTESYRLDSNDYLQRWLVSKPVNSSKIVLKADADDPTLIERVELEAA